MEFKLNGKEVKVNNDLKVGGSPIINIDGVNVGTLNDLYTSQDDNKISTKDLIIKKFL